MKQKKQMKQFYNDRLSEMKNSVWLGFHYSRKLNEATILEEHSRVPNIDTYIERFIWAFEKVTEGGTKDVLVNMTKNIFSDIKGCWFKDVNIKIQYKKEDRLKGDGVFQANTAKLENGILNCLNGTFAFGGDWGQLKPYIPEIISHEFLHAYECWQRMLGDKKSMLDTAKDSGYMVNQTLRATATNYVEEVLSNVFYYCHNMERRAYAAQLNQQLYRSKNEITDTESAMRILEQTPIYQHYVQLGQKLQEINNKYPNSQWYRADIERYYYELTGKELRASQVMKYMNRLYEKTWYFLRKKAMKYIRHIHESNENNGGGFVENLLIM